ncbi:MAG: tetratricopeptide repeat protein [Deltaproteobacteria bacterium]|nr:tetratricopeptide repeat protein [Deltaproteobacteria bacterium]
MGEVRKSLPIVSATERDPIDRLAEGDSAGVIEDLRRSLANDPADDVLWLRLGAVYLAIGHLPEAEDALGRAVSLDGDDVEARLLYADALTRLGKPDPAAFQLVQARRAAPGDARVHRQLGVAFLEKGLFEKAEACLAAAADLDPTDPRTPFLRGLLCDARKDTAASVAHHRRAVELDPDSVDARCTFADALATMGELAEAARQLEEALRRDRTNTRIAQNLDVLRRGLRELESHRLLGKTEVELERSTLVQRGQLKRAGHVDDGKVRAVRYRGSAVELLVSYDAERIAGMVLALTNPALAARTPDDVFEVTVVAPSGATERADVATALSVTFLREALGCPMTRAGELYARLLRDGAGTTWAGASLRLRELTIGDARLVGIEITAAG